MILLIILLVIGYIDGCSETLGSYWQSTSTIILTMLRLEMLVIVWHSLGFLAK